MYGIKIKKIQIFGNHWLRNNLWTQWVETKRLFFKEVPRWISPLEAFSDPKLIEQEKIITYEDLLDDQNKLKSWEELENKGFKIGWWQKSQIISRHNIDQKEGIQKRKTKLDIILTGPETKLLSKIYKILMERKLEREEVKNEMIKWARNIGSEITLEEWERRWGNIKKVKATSLKENWYKMFYRWHVTPVKIANMTKNYSKKCWKCHENEGTFYHMWWQCGKTKKYWIKVHLILQEVCQTRIELSPKIFLLNIMPNRNTKLTKQQEYICHHITTAARIVYATKWKNKEIPTELDLLAKILEIIEMDVLTDKLQDKKKTSKTYGHLFIDG